MNVIVISMTSTWTHTRYTDCTFFPNQTDSLYILHYIVKGYFKILSHRCYRRFFVTLFDCSLRLSSSVSRNAVIMCHKIWNFSFVSYNTYKQCIRIASMWLRWLNYSRRNRSVVKVCRNDWWTIKCNCITCYSRIFCSFVWICFNAPLWVCLLCMTFDWIRISVQHILWIIRDKLFSNGNAFQYIATNRNCSFRFSFCCCSSALFLCLLLPNCFSYLLYFVSKFLSSWCIWYA